MSRGRPARPAVTTQLGPGRIKRKCVVIRWLKGKGGGSRTTMGNPLPPLAARFCRHVLLPKWAVPLGGGGTLQTILTLTLESFIVEYLCTVDSLLESSFACTLPASFFASSKVSVVRIRPVSSLCHHSNIDLLVQYSPAPLYQSSVQRSICIATQPT
jgi:hypothetical protein